MFERDATSKADYQSAQQALATAKADLAAADASIAQYTVRAQTAQANVGYTRITAPMAGTVVAVVTDAGQTMNANQTAPTIVKLAVLDPMTIQSQISEADVPRVKPGMPAYFTILGEPDTQYQATLRSIEPGPIDMKHLRRQSHQQQQQQCRVLQRPARRAQPRRQAAHPDDGAGQHRARQREKRAHHSLRRAA